MDTSRIRRFATEARHVLLGGVSNRLEALGFSLTDGSASESPILREGGATFRGNIETEEFYSQWQSLKDTFVSHSVKEVVEEVAYTWFNRLMAIQILAKNGLVLPVLDYEAENIHIPRIVKDARQGRMPRMDRVTKEKVENLLRNESLTNDQFRILIVAFCHDTPIVSKCFGRINDYTELLLPQNILAGGGFVDMLNNTEFIADEDYHSPELIGWLYQFYISERKDEVYAQKGKFQAEDIPAATQIFTPNWIVKYMVQNTLGRIFLDNNPQDADEFVAKWKYLVTPSEPTPTEAIYRYEDIADLKVADLACGSGHILNEYFDLLLDLYRHEGYSQVEAIENIFTRNITGIDIDARAKQLATFSLLLKACQKDRSFTDAHCMPRVYDMPECDLYTWKEKCDHMVCNLKAPAYSEKTRQELEKAFDLMKDAKSLGSIMKFDISDETREFMEASIDCYKECEKEHLVNIFADLFYCFNIILALTDTYASLVMNPPYMGSGNMNGTLNDYVKKEYKDGKADLFSTFMLLAIDRLEEKGKYGMISMQSWMFLSSFSKLREGLLDNYHIESLLHLGPHTFDELSGEVVQNVAFVVGKSELDKGEYYRLVDGKDCGDKERMFLAGEIYYPNISQQNFEKIPGSPIGYWVSEKIIDVIASHKPIDVSYKCREGIHTTNNDRYVHLWEEVNFKDIVLDCDNYEDVDNNGTWVPYNKGGGYRKWYGINDYVIAFNKRYRDEMAELPFHVRPSQELYFKDGGTWSAICSKKFSIRYYPKGYLFDAGGHIAVGESVKALIGYMNTKLFDVISKLTMPTINKKCGIIKTLPNLSISSLQNIVQSCISVSKSDWDAHETSWDFQTNELVARIEPLVCKQQPTLFQDNVERSIAYTLEDLVEKYKASWEEKFLQLHANEEELNRQFIEIYGLQDELTPEVPLSEVTILQQGEISTVEGASGEELRWNDDVIIKQLISYAIGCMMGRYSIDKPGLILANQGDDEKRYNELVPNSRFEVDSNGIVPLMSSNMEFTDNATARFKKWLSVTFGEDNLTQNLNYVESRLGRRIDDYLVNGFWADHKKMYQNRPIYWLFASKNRAFQCLVYMHRMTPFTVEAIRTKYLLPHIEWLVNKQREMESNASNLSVRERKELDNIGKQIEECREYQERMHSVAYKRVAIDLDDGVVVNYAKYGDVLARIK